MNNGYTQIEGKFYKECDIVMLPTEKGSYIHLMEKGKLNIKPFPYKTETHYLKSTAQHLYFLSDEEIKEDFVGWVYQQGTKQVHYCTRVEFMQNGKLAFFDRDNLFTPLGNCKKIIAATDPVLNVSKYAKTKCPQCKSNMLVKLPDHLECESCGQKGWNLMSGVYHELQTNLPRPSNSFIEKFITEWNKGNKIEKVLVEMQMYDVKGRKTEESHVDNLMPIEFKIKPNNTIIIQPLVEKSYSRKEVEILCRNAFMRKDVGKGLPFDYTDSGIEQWIKQNL